MNNLPPDKPQAMVPLKKKKPKESSLESYLIKLCKENNILCYKFTSPGQSGVPDRILIHRGQVIFLELKRPGGKTQDLQDYHIDLINQAGGLALMADNKSKINQIIQDLLAR